MAPSPQRDDNPRPLVYIFSRAAIRQLDRLAVEHYGLPTLLLMENAASQIATHILDLLGGLASKHQHRSPSPPASVLILCGKGSNGGDGLALARHLHNNHIPVACLLAAPIDDYQGDAALNLHTIRQMGIRTAIADARDPAATFNTLGRELQNPALLIDALLGTGLDRPIDPRSTIGHLIAAINIAAATLAPSGDEPPLVLSIDLPSGMDADTGRAPAGSTTELIVSADLTITLVGHKLGFTNPASSIYLGQVAIADIGAPIELTHRLGKPTELKK